MVLYPLSTEADEKKKNGVYQGHHSKETRTLQKLLKGFVVNLLNHLLTSEFNLVEKLTFKSTIHNYKTPHDMRVPYVSSLIPTVLGFTLY